MNENYNQACLPLPKALITLADAFTMGDYLKKNDVYVCFFHSNNQTKFIVIYYWFLITRKKTNRPVFFLLIINICLYETTWQCKKKEKTWSLFDASIVFCKFSLSLYTKLSHKQPRLSKRITANPISRSYHAVIWVIDQRIDFFFYLET